MYDASMNYISSRRGDKLTNEPFIISSEDIKEMLAQNEKDARECEEVTKSSYRGESFYKGDTRPGSGKLEWPVGFFKEILYRDMKTSGFLMKYPHGIVIRQAERNHYYRGENQIYPKSVASIYRGLSKFKTEEEKSVYQLIADMRIAEFGLFLFDFAWVKEWQRKHGDVLIEPLAQHYGLETKWLDITNDFKTALFFACCYFEDDKWKPLTIGQTEVCDKRKYGVIFHAPQWNVNALNLSMYFDKESSRSVLPIGYQPFRRCAAQTGYGICMNREEPLQDEIIFEKLHFRHDEKLSKWIYEEMDCGKEIYPMEGLNEFDDIITYIRNADTFSEEAFEYAVERNRRFRDIDEAKRALEEILVLKRPVHIGRHPFHLSRQRRRRMDLKCERYSVESLYGIRILERPVLRPSGDLPKSDDRE